MKAVPDIFCYIGIPVYEKKIFDKFVRVRRHKKKRIDKKWRKRYGFKTTYRSNVCVLYKSERGDILICSPDIIKKIRSYMLDKKAKGEKNDILRRMKINFGRDNIARDVTFDLPEGTIPKRDEKNEIALIQKVPWRDRVLYDRYVVADIRVKGDEA